MATPALRAIGPILLYARAHFVRANTSLNSVRERGSDGARSQPTTLNILYTPWRMKTEVLLRDG